MGGTGMRVVTLCGTRPELIKLAPLVPLLSQRFDHQYLFTGQHYSPNMVQVFVDELDAPAPDRFLDVGSSAIDVLTAATTEALADFRPSLVLVYGDTNSTLAGARAARAAGMPVLHLEAGIRSFDLDMPEERNRVEVDSISTLRLAPTRLAAWFLQSLEGYVPSSCPVVGNLVVDALEHYRSRAGERPLPLGLSEAQPYAVLTLHRQATVDVPEVFERLLPELASLPLSVVASVHPRTAARMAEFGLAWPSNVLALEPTGYLDFLRLLVGASIALTDSGGVQEEACCLSVPCVTLRPNTERMESVFIRANRLFDPETDRGLAAVADQALNEQALRRRGGNPFGDGRAAERVVALIER
ncbi:MAG: UDP-N-acetylglucosamine 2-epimerase (non-hydrolyzing), partial [Actinomycetota bacterium]|nr:UDP-N-acetylglucosamine 2-epimerase (non-hydrolyzing) [Actinomycetota bacterium]